MSVRYNYSGMWGRDDISLVGNEMCFAGDVSYTLILYCMVQLNQIATKVDVAERILCGSRGLSMRCFKRFKQSALMHRFICDYVS